MNVVDLTVIVEFGFTFAGSKTYCQKYYNTFINIANNRVTDQY